MAYPYPELLPLLQTPLTPSQYLELRALRSSKPDVYQSALPIYVYAVCPICQTVCSDGFDTYSVPLSGLRFQLESGNVIPRDYPMAYNTPCAHYLGTHSFLNVHGITPVVDGFEMVSGEVPYLSPHFLPNRVESYAVLHALPVCQIIEGRFIPSFTRFIVTYFSRNPRLLIDEFYREQMKDIKDDDYYPYNLTPVAHKRSVTPVLEKLEDNFSSQEWTTHYRQLYDLKAWSSKRKLGWLNPSTLALEMEPEQTLPPFYSNIKGHPYYLIWFKGKFRAGYHL